MTQLAIGANTKLEQSSFLLTHNIAQSTDVSVFMLQQSQKVAGDDGMVFFGAPQSSCGGVSLNAKGISFDLAKIPADIVKLAVTATVDSGTFAAHAAIEISAPDFTAALDNSGRSEAALILLELYRHNGAWKVRCVGQGFNGGLRPLAEHFGVEVDDDEQAQAAPTAPAATSEVAPSAAQETPHTAAPAPLNVSKINLTKSSPRVDLTKRAGQLGTIKANLNWIPSTGGFFASKIDLDLGAYIELNNGQRTIVQALDQIFEYGDYIKLLGDDRSGDSIDGEWMHINGDRLDEVKRIIIYAFIYQGTPNWEKAKAKVTLHVPDMPPIETHLTEEDKNSTFCAIAELKVASGAVQVERLNRFFNGHMECDQAYGWGFSWQKGSK